MIELSNIYKTYNMGGEKINALDGISLTIGSGEFVGPSSALPAAASPPL